MQKRLKDLKVTDLCSPLPYKHTALEQWLASWSQSPNPLAQVRATLRFALHFRIQESGLSYPVLDISGSLSLRLPLLPSAAHLSASVPGENSFHGLPHAFGSPSCFGHCAAAPRLVQFQTLGTWMPSWSKSSPPLWASLSLVEEKWNQTHEVLWSLKKGCSKTSVQGT